MIRSRNLHEKMEALTSVSSDASVNSTSAKSSFNFLMQSVPNPAKNSVDISYKNLPQGAHANLILYDNNGRQMKQVQLSKESNGSAKIDVSSFSPGIYSCSLLINGRPQKPGL